MCAAVAVVAVALDLIYIKLKFKRKKRVKSQVPQTSQLVCLIFSISSSRRGESQSMNSVDETEHMALPTFTTTNFSFCSPPPLCALDSFSIAAAAGSTSATDTHHCVMSTLKSTTGSSSGSGSSGRCMKSMHRGMSRQVVFARHPGAGRAH